MDNFIIVTRLSDGTQVLVNPNHIVQIIVTSGDTCAIELITGEIIRVRESFDIFSNILCAV